MNSISIIGAGKLGTSLGRALAQNGFKIDSLSCRRLSSAIESRRIIGQGYPSDDNIETARSAKIVILSVPDDEIERVARELALSDIKWDKKIVFHCSGLLSTKILNPLRAKGSLTSSIHPIQSFSSKNTNPSIFEGTYFSLEGNAEALKKAKVIISKLGSHFFTINPKDKPLYHVSCCVASNFLIVLLDMAVSILKKVNLKEEMAFQILMPLIQETLQNVKNFAPSSSLTGPIPRGDQHTVEKHLKALEEFPYFHDTYEILSNQALEIVRKEKKLSSQKIKALKSLLQRK